MFSDNYIVSDKYSIVTEEYISTRETMPWFYTSLYDSSYLPIMDADVAYKLNLFFRYRYLHTNDPLRDDLKNLIIEHNDNNILGYEIVNPMKYISPTTSASSWKQFINSIDCLGLDLCKPKIDRMTDETDEYVTQIINIQYDQSASFTGVAIFDSSYNLSEYQSNDTLKVLNDMCKEHSGNLRGVITFHPDSENIKFKVMMNYPEVSLELYRDPKYNDEQSKFAENAVVLNKPETYRDFYISLLRDNALITEEQSDYMKSIFSTNSRFDVEFILGKDSQIIDIHLINFRIYEFKDLTTA